MNEDLKLDFNKIKKSSLDDSDDLSGVYWDKIPEDAPFMSLYKHTCKTKKHPPIFWINSSVEEHYTQIMFILKEHFTDEKKGFTGWGCFTQKNLFEICEKDYKIYEKEWTPNGKEFVKKFPDKIKSFIKKYCE